MKESIARVIRFIERSIIYTLIVMMTVVLLLATIELVFHLLKLFNQPDSLLINLSGLMEIFGIFLLVLIGIELLHTIKIYLKQNIVHVEVVILISIIAVARKVVVLNLESMSGEIIIGIGFLILCLSVSYYLIKKTGILTFDMNAHKKDNEPQDKFEEIIEKQDKNISK